MNGQQLIASNAPSTKTSIAATSVATQQSARLAKFHASSVRASARKILGPDADIGVCGDGAVLYFAPGKGRVGKANAEKYLQAIQTEFLVTLEPAERLGSIAQKSAWAATGDDFQTFVTIRKG